MFSRDMIPYVRELISFDVVSADDTFNVEVIDNDHFLTIKLNEHSFINMVHDEKIQALQYVVKLKEALEENGAIVLVTREAIK